MGSHPAAQAHFDALPVPALSCRRDGSGLVANGALREVVGSSGEVPSSCWEWLESDDPRLSLDSVVARALEHERTPAIAAVVRRPDGRTLPARLDVRAVGDDELVVVVHLLDEEIRQQAKLRASQERFEKVAGNVPAGILSSQAGMRVDYANQRCCEVFGAPAEVLLGFGWLDFVHPDDAVAAEHAVAEVIASRSEAHLPLRIVRPDGSVRWAELRVAPVHSARDVGFVATIEDVTASRRLTEELTIQARQDPLTGLPNRLALRELLAERLAAGGRTTALLFVDLDHFKDVNDSLGHGAGDRLLVVVAERLAACVRHVDTVARFGGDEFAIVLGDVAGPERVDAVARRIVEVMRAPIDLSGHLTVVTASVGIVHAEAMRAYVGRVDVEALLRDADVAMYQAKRAGRNRTAAFDEQVRADAQQRLLLHSALRRAVDELAGERGGGSGQATDELSLAYQPIVELRSGRICGVEALMRWDLPIHGRIAPLTFIPLAEETGLISRLGRFAIGRALTDLVRWRALPGSGDLWVSVNLSARDLAEADLVGAVAAALHEHGLPGAALRLELTESAVMTDPGHAQEVLEELQRLGVGISVDDFGTGYSSLAYLQRLPVDAIKIDRSFVERLEADASTTVLLEAIVALATALGMAVVAEGVEHRRQAERLVELGAGFAQGYLFARPLPGAEVDDLLRASAR